MKDTIENFLPERKVSRKSGLTNILGGKIEDESVRVPLLEY